MNHLPLLLFITFVAICYATPLDDYVNAPDPSYKWTLNGTRESLLYTAYDLRLTSQYWMTLKDSNWPLWQHWVQICIPKVMKTSSAFLYIDGGENTDGAPGNVYPPLEAICLGGSVSAHLQEIPNEPITFENDGVARMEDALIAFTWSHFFNDTSDPTWLARLPMTKAAVKAMDAVQEFVATLKGEVPEVDSFVVCGASKRGWTTWTTAAVDSRVIGIIPIVMPILNMIPNMNHQYQAYGGWSFALQDYLNLNLMSYLNKPQFTDLAAVVDPFTYINRLTMPKYVITATGDEFFLPDSPSFFWDALLGSKHLRLLPDAEHSLAGHELELTEAVVSFFNHVVANQSMPEITWQATPDSNGTVIFEVTTSETPTKVQLYHATTISKVRRDFRLVICTKIPECIQPVLWFAEDLTASSNNTFTAVLEPPDHGWKGYFIEVQFGEFICTSEVQILPNTLPFPPCGNNCQPNNDSV